jgi:DNA-binding CsgD family transcriptional regulator/tetratricopeptide (TPR) repeat protein
VGAADIPSVIALAPAAGRWAADLGAHREAVAHYAAALKFRARLGVAQRAALLEAFALECRLVNDVGAARLAQEEALTFWRRAGDRVREAECQRQLSTTMYFQGEVDAAMRAAEAAVTMLESDAPGTPALALALATVAQRRLQEGRDDDATLATGRHALELAERIGYEPAAVHALTTVAVTEIYVGLDAGWAHLEESRGRAAALGLTEEVTHALVSLVETACDMRRHDVAEASLAEALPYAERHGLVLLQRFLLGRRAELALERGEWDDAGRESQALLDRADCANQVRVRALTLLGRIRARRGDGDPWPLLDEALASVGPWQLQELCPLRAARAEAAWLAGEPDRAAGEAMLGLQLARQSSSTSAPWWWGELAFWAWRSGAAEGLPDQAPEPYRRLAEGRHAAAAAAWRRLDCPYEAAFALADSDDVGHLQAALSTLNALGATPMARRVSDRLRGLGERRIPRGPRPSTRGNPAHLTIREVEVLRLVTDGLRNAEIAERLVLSVKTVDHHVSSVLRKLEVDDRDAAGREAVRLGLRLGPQDR